MNFKPLILTTLLSATLGLLILPPQSSKAQPGQLCAVNGNYEPASETNRTVELPEFGIAVEIPSNFRTMQRQDGSIEVLHPNDFESIQCIAQGGFGGHGYYSTKIRAVMRDPSMSLRSQARSMPGYELANDYQSSNLNGYIINSPSGYGVTFLGYVGGEDRLFEISAVCDCPVEIENLTDFLQRVKPLD